MQNEAVKLTTAAKVELIERLTGAGVQRVEVASFVSPTRVPQMADAEQIMAALTPRPGVSYIGLVLNRKGFDRALAAGCREISMAVFASDTFNRRNQGASTEESIATWLEVAAAARAAQIRAQVTISAAFGCPFEGEIPAVRVVEIARRLGEGEPFEIALADTIGVGVPAQVTDLVERVTRAVPGVPLRGHFHNTRNTGLANAYAAVQAGIRAFDSSVGGIGGCPFAPSATGNIPTEDLLYMLHRSGFQTGISLDGLLDAGRWLQDQLGHTVPGMLLKAGSFPRAAAS
ncbi:MAG: hydroxymethylglutaryl-CoA lyase [Gemmatimonadetes bacterium]|nr:hydroxymethylglutaryl-CoA lyase [Gemmatimonadota bacterium]